MTLLALTEEGVRLKVQGACARCDIRCGGVYALRPAFSVVFRRRRLDKPFGVENAVAQPKHWRDEALKPLAGNKGMVAQPPPTDAFGEDIARLLAALRRHQPHLENPLEMRAAHVACGGAQLAVERFSFAAFNDRDI